MGSMDNDTDIFTGWWDGNSDAPRRPPPKKKPKHHKKVHHKAKPKPKPQPRVNHGKLRRLPKEKPRAKIPGKTNSKKPGKIPKVPKDYDHPSKVPKVPKLHWVSHKNNGKNSGNGGASSDGSTESIPKPTVQFPGRHNNGRTSGRNTGNHGAGTRNHEHMPASGRRHGKGGSGSGGHRENEVTFKRNVIGSSMYEEDDMEPEFEDEENDFDSNEDVNEEEFLNVEMDDPIEDAPVQNDGIEAKDLWKDLKSGASYLAGKASDLFSSVFGSSETKVETPMEEAVKEDE